MHRREFFPASAAVAGAALVGSLPAVLTAPAFPNTGIPWKETSTTLALRNQVNPPVQLVASKRDVHVLTADAWSELSVHHGNLGNLYSQLGNIHAYDNWIRAHETYLKSVYNPAYIDTLIQYGMHYVWAVLSQGMQDTSNSFCAFCPGEGCCPWKYCRLFYKAFAVGFGISALIFTDGIAVGFFGSMAVMSDLLEAYLCS